MTDAEIKEGRVAAASSPQASKPGLAAAGGAGAVETESFGRALAAARQARGLSLGDVAAQLRLQLRQVRAIEAEDLGALPEGAYVRGFVRNYAKLVDIPAEPLLKLLNARLQPSAPLRESQASNGISPVRLAARERASRLAVVGGAMVLLLVFAVLGWWTMRPSGPQVAPPPQVESLRPASSPPPVAAPAKVVPPQEAAPAAQAPIEVAATAPASEAAATTPASTAAGAPSTPAPLHFNFRGRSWVQVTQADGSVLMSRTNSSGERTTVEGTPPYALVIGNASKVDLEFRGRTIDLRASTGRGDIARLRLE